MQCQELWRTPVIQLLGGLGLWFRPELTECTSALAESMLKTAATFQCQTYKKKVDLIMYTTHWMGIQTPLLMVI